MSGYPGNNACATSPSETMRPDPGPATPTLHIELDSGQYDVNQKKRRNSLTDKTAGRWWDAMIKSIRSRDRRERHVLASDERDRRVRGRSLKWKECSSCWSHVLKKKWRLVIAVLASIGIALKWAKTADLTDHFTVRYRERNDDVDLTPQCPGASRCCAVACLRHDIRGRTASVCRPSYGNLCAADSGRKKPGRTAGRTRGFRRRHERYRLQTARGLVLI